jgi:hypothetical protein
VAAPRPYIVIRQPGGHSEPKSGGDGPKRGSISCGWPTATDGIPIGPDHGVRMRPKVSCGWGARLLTRSGHTPIRVAFGAGVGPRRPNWGSISCGRPTTNDLRPHRADDTVRTRAGLSYGVIGSGAIRLRTRGPDSGQAGGTNGPSRWAIPAAIVCRGRTSLFERTGEPISGANRGFSAAAPPTPSPTAHLAGRTGRFEVPR